MASTQQKRKKVAIGIDLGTTNSCVAVVRNGRVEIIANDRGNRLTPSYVAFTDEERLVGDVAKGQATWNPENTVFDVKRFIGRKFDDSSVQDGIKNWPFKVIDVGGNPKVQVQYKGQKKTLSAEEISSMVLSKMKEAAETYLGHPVTDAVITVPAYFKDSQRMATMDAGAIAGLNVLRILNEPTAAAIAYGVDKKISDKRNILIYDFGGGTFDLVIIAVESGKFEVLGVKGNTHLGGSDIDDRLLAHFVEEVKSKHNVDITNDKKALGRLRKECTNAKIALSSSVTASIQIESIHQGIDFESSLSRSCLESLCSDLFENTMKCVQSALQDSGLSKEDIIDVVLCGGSTRIPKVLELLEAFFKGRPINNSLNPDEAVAYGAAMKASMLSGENTVEDIFLQEVTPLSLGCAQIEDEMVTVIKQNTKIPVKLTRSFTTVRNFQKCVSFHVYEGERRKASLNHLLGHFVLDGVEDALEGVPQISCTFEVDVNGILRVDAVDRKTSAENGVTITSNRGRIDKVELERLQVEEKLYQENVARRKKNQRACNELEAFIQTVTSSNQHKKVNGVISDVFYAKVLEACDETMQWLKNSREIQKKDCFKKRDDLENLIKNLADDPETERKSKWPKVIRYVKSWVTGGN